MIFTTEHVAPLRKKMQMSREEFAAEIGCGSRAVYNWEKGKTAKINRAVRNNMIALYQQHMED
jgi:DNA-binding transcriptional regulator YiaG